MVSKHGAPLGVDGQNMVVMHACKLYNCLMCMHGDCYCFSCVVM